MPRVPSSFSAADSGASVNAAACKNCSAVNICLGAALIIAAADSGAAVASEAIDLSGKNLDVSIVIGIHFAFAAADSGASVAAVSRYLRSVEFKRTVYFSRISAYRGAYPFYRSG